jgi:hypothetical protein
VELTVQRIGPDYACVYGGIRLTFSRIHESREDISGMLQVELRGYGGREDGDLFDGRVILTGSNSKRDAAAACRTRVGEFEDWGGLIEKACIVVRRAWSIGTPFVDLAVGAVTHTESPPLLDPFWCANEHAILFGDGGSGKSLIALAHAALLASGTSAWGCTVHGGPHNVGYVDFEDDEENFRLRLAQISAPLGIPRPQVWYKRGETSLVAMVDGLARACAELSLDGLIFDHVGIACTGEPETAAAANDYFRALRQLPIRWSINIAHQPKDKARSEQPYGSVYWWNNARSIWRVVAGRRITARSRRRPRLPSDTERTRSSSSGVRPRGARTSGSTPP